MFLQTVAVPVFGTNSPLWSLANEFWYYVLFPLLCWAVAWKRPMRAMAAAGLCGFLLWWLPGGLAAKMGIWLFGTAAGNGCFDAGCRGRFIWRLLGAGIFALVLAGSKWRPQEINDWVVGGVFALWLPALSGRWSAPEWLRRMAKGLAEISYTLYVVHFPLLFLAVTAGLQGRQWLPDGMGLGIYTAFLAGTVAVSVGWWWCFEKRTESVRAWVQRQWG
ncbi:acyltransferase family protein [Termitidicoccus mucosus]|uniref:acyltransferase family protein n=1 Tax=Termitidicoccus mucosus TaxID=1184151 RepID=UPI00083903EB